MPTVVIARSISGNFFSTSSTSRTFPSVYSRLEPTGVLSRSEMKLWSVCGMNSVPTSGTIRKLPKNEATAIAITLLRWPSAQRSTRP